MERFFYSIVYIASCLIGFLASRSLTLSISKQDESVHSISLSPVVTDPAKSRPLREVRRCSINIVAVGDGGSRCAPSSRCWRWRGGRSSVPLFTAVVWSDPACPPKRHLAHLRYNLLYWSSSQVDACGFCSMRLLPSSPCIVARVRRLVQHHLLLWRKCHSKSCLDLCLVGGIHVVSTKCTWWLCGHCPYGPIAAANLILSLVK